MEILPLSDAIGAEISGVDLSKPLHDKTISDINNAWHEYIVLLFRDQDIDADQQINFAKQFGDVGVRSRPVERRPEGADYNASVMLVSNVKKDGKYIGSLPDGEMWFHHDMCYDKAPHKGTFLYAMELPSTGGNTLFANMYTAYDNLSDELKIRVAGKHALQIYDFATRETVDISDDISKYKHEVQPVTIAHPVTGRRALYVNPLITARIEGMPESLSRAMLNELFAFADNPSIAYEHEWRKGDLMMWDNWCSCHARTDFPANERRMLRRCTIKGQPLHE
ncbi:MAG: (R)-phenoxypropionate/alpha-ketoglutarate-dioxygenase [Alphaproteobacteria bacterium MarineAlpha11_Bin1]|nr:MAG: (R)-phenoxypropionate/alpha-ketoglutarate-dioxygenase [Alphaproteobacteria bacterium MarineAlpha11_Bin1]|tara:strand:- start:5760 stop:6599 length:840 start_codon:yes stop_codon:yes gene_type:complete